MEQYSFLAHPSVCSGGSVLTRFRVKYEEQCCLPSPPLSGLSLVDNVHGPRGHHRCFPGCVAHQLRQCFSCYFSYLIDVNQWRSSKQRQGVIFLCLKDTNAVRLQNREYWEMLYNLATFNFLHHHRPLVLFIVTPPPHKKTAITPSQGSNFAHSEKPLQARTEDSECQKFYLPSSIEVVATLLKGLHATYKRFKIMFRVHLVNSTLHLARHPWQLWAYSAYFCTTAANANPYTRRSSVLL